MSTKSYLKSKSGCMGFGKPPLLGHVIIVQFQFSIWSCSFSLLTNGVSSLVLHQVNEVREGAVVVEQKNVVSGIGELSEKEDGKCLK